jgi:undecaprenyl diphosphate synthase
VLWPDFDAVALQAALVDYQGRSRRFGGVDPIQ